MCQEWLDDPAAFLADMGPKPEGLTLERKDVNGSYCPANCIWATPQQQSNNKTSSIRVDHEGKTMVLKEFAKIMGVGYKAIYARVKYKGQTPQFAAEQLRKG